MIIFTSNWTNVKTNCVWNISCVIFCGKVRTQFYPSSNPSLSRDTRRISCIDLHITNKESTSKPKNFLSRKESTSICYNYTSQKYGRTVMPSPSWLRTCCGRPSVAWLTSLLWRIPRCKFLACHVWIQLSRGLTMFWKKHHMMWGDYWS